MIIRNKFNGYNRDGTRQYHKGGDGGAKEARKQEAERQARITAAVDTINGIFDGKPVRTGRGQAGSFDPSKTYYDARGNTVWTAKPQQAAPEPAAPPDFSSSDWRGFGRRRAEEPATPPPTQEGDPEYKRMSELAASGGLFEGYDETPGNGDREALYKDQKQAVFELNKRDVDRQYKDAERANRFGLARSGLMGGSVDVDSNAELQEKTNEGLMRATGIADAAAADLKTQDERARQSLISMAQSGIDTGTAQTMAMRQLDATAQAANGARQGATIGGLFDDMSQAYLMRQVGQGMRAGQNPNQQWYGVSSPQQSYGGTTTRGN